MSKTLKTNLFIVGAPKAGTTTWVDLLSKNKDIYVSPIKEPNFFGEDFKFEAFSKTYRERYYFDSKNYFNKKEKQHKHICFIRKKEDYANLFCGASEKYRLDGSTSYLYSKTAAEEIHKYNPKAKIIISLRNPVERALSHYSMLISNGNEKERNPLVAFQKDYLAKKKGFGISHLYIEMGLYLEQIKRYYETFPEEQILVLDFSDVFHHSQKIKKQLGLFLEIDLEKENLDQKNKTILPTHSFLIRFKTSHRFRKWRKFVPKTFKDKIKSTALFKKKPKSTYETQEVLSFLQKKLNENWRQTIAFLQEKEVELKQQHDFNYQNTD